METVPVEVRKLFEYSPSAPLDLQERSAETHDGALVHDVTYASPVKGRVTAYVVVPRGKGPFAGVVFQHWGFGDRTEFLPEMLLLARAGAVSISIDAPWARPDPWKTEDEGGHISHPEIDRDIYVQTVVDLRRAVDVLLSRKDVDAKRIGFVGHSYGATWGGVLAGVEKRIRTHVLMAGLPDVADFSPSGAKAYDAISDQIKAQFNNKAIQHYVDIISPIAPVRFIGNSAPASVFMQFADKDAFISPSAAQRYYAGAGNPKKQKWYFTSHELNDPAALTDRVQWLQEQLQLRPVSAELVTSDTGIRSAQSAAEHLSDLRRQADSARASGNLRERLSAVLKIKDLLNDTPKALEAVAQAYAELGETERALDELSRFADMGQADDSLLRQENTAFASMSKLSRYQSILKRFALNKAIIVRSETAFSLPDASLLAEDIDYNPRSRSFLITSVLERKIIQVGPQGKAADFAQSPSHWPILAIKVDSSRGLVWATEVALDGFATVPRSDWGRSAVLCFDLTTAALRLRIEGPTHSALGDMVLDGEGTPIVSDGANGGVYRVRKGRLERIDKGDFISPQTPAMHPDGRHIFIPDYSRGIGVLDAADGSVIWLKGGGGKDYALSGIDGLYFNAGSLIATQNGTSPERVIRFQMDSTLTGINSEEIVETGTPTLGDPTHGVVVDEFFYYIANSGWSEIDEHGSLKLGTEFTPARIMRFPLRS